MASLTLVGTEDQEGWEERAHRPLPRGLFRLDISGRILHFAPAVGAASALDEAAAGQNFFDELAPCIRLRDARARFAEGVRRRDLFETLECLCRCPSEDLVRVTLYYSRISDTAWALVESPE